MNRKIRSTPQEDAFLAGWSAQSNNVFSGASQQQYRESLNEFIERLNIRVKNIMDEQRADQTNSNLYISLFSSVADQLEKEYIPLSGNVDLLGKVIHCRRQALVCATERNIVSPRLLFKLGTSMRARFEEIGEIADLDEATDCYRRLHESTAEGDPDYLAHLFNFAAACWVRYQRLGRLEDLQKAIGVQRTGIERHPNHNLLQLSNLGNMLMCRFMGLGDVADWDEMLKCYTRTLQILPDTHSHKPGLLNNLGGAYTTRFEKFGTLEDLSVSIEYRTQGLRICSENDVLRPKYLIGLAQAYFSRSEQLGNLADIEAAIESYELADHLTAQSDGVDKASILCGLGIMMLRRFERLGSLEDIDKSVGLSTRGVHMISGNDKNLPMYLCNLGSAYTRRFERLGELADIDQAIEYQTKAAQSTHESDESLPGYFSNLGSSWMFRFMKLHQLVDLDKATEYQARALKVSNSRPKEQYILLDNVARCLSLRFEITHDPEDASQAVEYRSRAVELTPEGHPGRAYTMSNLGGLLGARFRWFGNPHDLDTAIECYSHAARLASGDDPKRPTHLWHLGELYLLRHQTLDNIADLRSGTLRFQNCAELVAIDPKIQMGSARAWAKSSIVLDDSPLPAYQRAFALIPHLVWLGQTIQERYGLLNDLTDLAAEAAAWAISAGLYDLAIEWLEEGRSIVWSQILRLRAPLEDLAALDPDLAHRLKAISVQLEGAATRKPEESSSDAIKAAAEAQSQHHRRLAAQWDQLLAEARRLPGFSTLLAPRKAQELKKAAQDGPIVLVNVHSSRCDALVIFPECDDVTHIPLGDFSANKSAYMRERVFDLIGRRGDGNEARGFKSGTKDSDKIQPLRELWLGVVGPVLSTLACTSKETPEELPHVTWCVTGTLSFLPLHAAGPYNMISSNALDLAVFSYTPTLGALLNHSARASKPHTGVLAIGQANTAGLPPLPNTITELEIIEKHTQNTRYQKLEGSLATVDDTLNAMEDHSWVHIACHAIQDRGNPSHSAFYLHDGNLTLDAIMKRAFKNKGLAFLSACQTAMGDDDLPDEATHLAAGMLIAGYPSVIGTMWSIADEDGPTVADRVYAELMRGETVDHVNSARALHKAVVCLRRQVGVKSIGRWAPFIHIGI